MAPVTVTKDATIRVYSDIGEGRQSKMKAEFIIYSVALYNWIFEDSMFLRAGGLYSMNPNRVAE